MHDNDLIYLLVGVMLGIMVRMSYSMLYGKNKKKRDIKDSDPDQHQDSSSDEDESIFPAAFTRNQGAVVIDESKLFKNFPINEVKMVLVVREDLKMGKGKIGAQCGHATLGAYKAALRQGYQSKYWNKVMEKWSWEGQKKVCVKVKTDYDLLQIQKGADKLGIPSYLVADAGLTQIRSGSLTVCGLGPAEAKLINILTGDKKLL